MKLGVLTVPLSAMPLDKAMEYLKGLGVQAVELGCGGYPGNAHANAPELLGDAGGLEALRETLKQNDMIISALSCHGNPVHPNKELGRKSHADFENAVLLAEKLGVDRVITFSGCPGGASGDASPNWVTCAWPDDFTRVLDYQWNEVLIPYWKRAAAFAREHGVSRIALEMHPGFCVYNPETLLRLRAEVGPEIGANFDPSHLVWQGIDPISAIRALGKQNAIFHFHAKDTLIDALNTGVNGVLDTKNYGDILNRAWTFRTVGYGHGYSWWKDIVTALKTVGYDHCLSIEHEDAFMSVSEGLEKAISFMREVMFFEEPGDMWWA